MSKGNVYIEFSKKQEHNIMTADMVLQTSFLQGVLRRNLRYVATLNKQHLSNFTINTVQVYGQEKYLLV